MQKEEIILFLSYMTQWIDRTATLSNKSQAQNQNVRLLDAQSCHKTYRLQSKESANIYATETKIQGCKKSSGKTLQVLNIGADLNSFNFTSGPQQNHAETMAKISSSLIPHLERKNSAHKIYATKLAAKQSFEI
ncbi:MAG: hypothetical protein KBD78_02095 [Oligoflexales bacterium]|nr:hypothetical protein [Oligoflexales bacterium]